MFIYLVIKLENIYIFLFPLFFLLCFAHSTLTISCQFKIESLVLFVKKKLVTGV